MNSLLIATAALVDALQSISLHPGETVTVRIDNGIAVVEATAPAQPITKFELYALWRAETEYVPPSAKTVPPGFVEEGEGPPNPPHPSDNRLLITMRQVPAIKPGSPENTALFITNGYGSTFRYQAAMSADGRSAPTDVCEIAPHMLGLEHWPYPLERLELSDLSLEQSNGTVECR